MDLRDDSCLSCVSAAPARRFFTACNHRRRTLSADGAADTKFASTLINQMSLRDGRTASCERSMYSIQCVDA